MQLLAGEDLHPLLRGARGEHGEVLEQERLDQPQHRGVVFDHQNPCCDRVRQRASQEPRRCYRRRARSSPVVLSRIDPDPSVGGNRAVLFRRAPSDQDRAGPADRADDFTQRAGERRLAIVLDRGERDEIGPERAHQLAELRRRGALAEHGDPRAAALLEAEGRAEQPELVGLLGEAGTDDVEALVAPAPVDEADQPRADRLGHQVLLGDRERARVPALADLLLDGEEELLDRVQRRERGEHLVEDRVDLRLVHPLRGVEQRGPPLLERARVGAGRGGGGEPVAQPGHPLGRLGDRDPLVGEPLQLAEHGDVVVGVDAVAAGRAGRGDHAVAALPGANQGFGHAGELGGLRDAVLALRHFGR